MIDISSNRSSMYMKCFHEPYITFQDVVSQKTRDSGAILIDGL